MADPEQELRPQFACKNPQLLLKWKEENGIEPDEFLSFSDVCRFADFVANLNQAGAQRKEAAAPQERCPACGQCSENNAVEPIRCVHPYHVAAPSAAKEESRSVQKRKAAMRRERPAMFGGAAKEGQ